MSVDSNILLKTPKGGKTISDTLSYALSAALFVFWPQFDIICDLKYCIDAHQHGIYSLTK